MTDPAPDPVAVLVAPGAADDDPARRIAAALGLPVLEAPPDRRADGPLVLAFDDGRLELREPGDRPGRGVGADFEEIDLRTGSGNLSRKQPLPKAIGAASATVVDATAGLGHDAMLLAAMGFDVTAIERHPLLAALLRNGLERAARDPRFVGIVPERIRIVEGDAAAFLATLDPRPDAVYIDPMYPPKKKASALPRKPIRLVRRIVGDDPDAAALVAAARASGIRRVVVKRPVHGEPLGGEPDLSFGGKLARYDVYQPKG